MKGAPESHGYEISVSVATSWMHLVYRPVVISMTTMQS
jgi:hypothetical protein